MVVLHVKREESLFLLETTLKSDVDDTLNDIIEIYHGQLKVIRLCSEFKALSNYGVYRPAEKSDVIDNELKQLEISEYENKGCPDFIPKGGHEVSLDPSELRIGLRPKQDMRDILSRSAAEALAMISSENVKSNTALTKNLIDESIRMLKGAITLVYENGLPEYDPIEIEFQNHLKPNSTTKCDIKVEDTSMWFANKKLVSGKKLSDYFGNNEKSKVIVKLAQESAGPPPREPIINEKEKLKMIAMDKKRSEIKIETIRAASADSLQDINMLKKKMHGMQDITWK